MYILISKIFTELLFYEEYLRFIIFKIINKFIINNKNKYFLLNNELILNQILIQIIKIITN